MPPVQDPRGGEDRFYYERLEVGPTASHEEIVRAYRRLALGLHPDARPEDPEAPRRFREITEAYEVLTHPQRREAYDRTRLSRRIPVRHLTVTWGGPGQGTADVRPTNDPGPPTFLGTPGSHPVGDLPLCAGPVRIDGHSEHHVGASSTTIGTPRSALADLLFEILDSWWRR